MKHLLRGQLLFLLLAASTSLFARSLVVLKTDGQAVYYLMGDEVSPLLTFTGDALLVTTSSASDTYPLSTVTEFFISQTDDPNVPDAIASLPLNPQTSAVPSSPSASRKFIRNGRLYLLDSHNRLWDPSGRPTTYNPQPSTTLNHEPLTLNPSPLTTLTPSPLPLNPEPLTTLNPSPLTLNHEPLTTLPLFALYFSSGFLQNRMTLTLAPGESIRFESMRFYVVRSDASEERYLYTKAEHFYLAPPPQALYRPNYLRRNDFESDASQYAFSRSRQSDHFIVYWEAAFGADPTTAPSPYTFDPDELLARAEKAYDVYTTQLGFGDATTSTTLATYKINIFVHYQDTWRATGSGNDFKAGSLDVNPAASKNIITTAHEIGHTFQYIVSCDFDTPRDHGWQWGFEESATGLCGWWESCAQWQAYKVYPEREFIESWETHIYLWSHLNLLHERMRYYNFFVQDYWCQLHGPDFIGRLWRESVRPEDPVEAFCRLTNTSHDGFCRVMYDYACRAITWDIDALRQNGRRRTDRFTTSMHSVTLSSSLNSQLSTLNDMWWQVDSACCPQNYGFNIIRLTVPSAGTEVSVSFQGIAGAPGYRAYNADKAGWRYGFVALQEDGTRVYGPMMSATAAAPTGIPTPDDPTASAYFIIPENTTNLWFVVLGAPTEHWHHPWDMGTDSNGDDVFTPASLANDEQWPYRLQFIGAARRN